MENDIIGDFYQGLVKIREETKKCLDDYKNGNCVTIALIKAALVQFGSIDKIFSEYSVGNEEVTVKFMDGITVSISNEEKGVVRDISGVKKKDNSEFYETGIELFAIIAKRVFLLKADFSEKCIHTFRDAVEYLNSGYPTKNAPKLLALDKQHVRKKSLNQYKSVIIYSSAHAAYCSYGNQDVAGRSNKVKRLLGVSWMKNLRGVGGKVKGAFILKHIES
ncbi:MAG: hypothetical protein AB8B56_07115 [Crocinitomicaceae bacterium]